MNTVAQTIQQVKSLQRKQVHLQFARLSATKKTRCLLILLEEVLTQPSALLHMQTLNLQRQLNDGNLQCILNHLAKQPAVPRHILPPSGTFESMTPLCMEHKECLDLLRSNSVTYSDGNALSVGANILLQTVLKIFQDSYTMHDLDFSEHKSSARRAAITM